MKYLLKIIILLIILQCKIPDIDRGNIKTTNYIKILKEIN